jgi:hypothetical protein
MTTTPNPTDKSDPVFVEVVEALRAANHLAQYADYVPKNVPAAGYCSTEHQFSIEAGVIWGLDDAVKAYRAATAKLTPEYLIELSAIAGRLEAAEKTIESYDGWLATMTELQFQLKATQSELAAARGKACSLWMLLDDIDTAEDMAKSDDAAFRTIAHFKHRKRFEIMSGEEIDALSPISQATEKT